METIEAIKLHLEEHGCIADIIYNERLECAAYLIIGYSDTATIDIINANIRLTHDSRLSDDLPQVYLFDLHDPNCLEQLTLQLQQSPPK